MVYETCSPICEFNMATQTIGYIITIGGWIVFLKKIAVLLLGAAITDTRQVFNLRT